MHKPRIIFFDIDGTLIDMEKKRITERTLDALRRLQQNGILLAIATGRSPLIVPKFDGVEFDVFLKSAIWPLSITRMRSASCTDATRWAMMIFVVSGI